MPLDDNQNPSGVSDGLELVTEQPATTTETTDNQSNVPAKYRGKSVEELIQMHEHAERALSRQGNELGEMRRIADGLIGLSRNNQPNTKTVERQPVTVEKLLENPDRVIESRINEAVTSRASETDARVAQLESQIAANAFINSFPNYQADMADPEFISWVQKNPLRANLAAAAYQNNYTAASSLWSLWEEHKQERGTADQAAAAASRVRAVRDAKTIRQGETNPQPAPKIYSRAKLMELRAKVNQGDAAAKAQWESKEFQEALIRAHSEGRVR